MHLPTVALALGLALVPCSARTTCAPVPCDAWLRETARWTGRFAVVVTGHVRTVTQQVPTLAAVVAAHASEGLRVDVFYHLWADPARDACHARALRTLRPLAKRVTYEPLACSWSWCGAKSFRCQWHLVDRAVLGGALRADDARADETYSLVLRTRADVRIAEPRALNFSALWSAHAGAHASSHFLVLAEDAVLGWDVAAAGTPALMRMLARAPSDALVDAADPLFREPDDAAARAARCDGIADAFMFRRPARHGVRMPPAEAARTDRARPVPLEADDPEPTPFCAPLFTARFGTRVQRATPKAAGCPDDHRPRRLGLARPADWELPNRSYCLAHQQEVFYDAGVS